MPHRLKMWAAGQQGIHGSGWYLFNQKTKELQGVWISPVEVFDNEQERVGFCVFLHEGDAK